MSRPRGVPKSNDSSTAALMELFTDRRRPARNAEVQLAGEFSPDNKSDSHAAMQLPEQADSVTIKKNVVAVFSDRLKR